MDLTNRPGTYRNGVARCPGCGEALREEAIVLDQASYAPNEVFVDLCDACGGLWLDWFDGEVQALAAGAEAARLDRGTLPPRSSARSEPRPQPPCPRCLRPLVAELYRFQDAREGELVTGVELLRCEECAGSFVSRASAYLLLDRVREPRPPTVWDALVGWLLQVVRAPPAK